MKTIRIVSTTGKGRDTHIYDSKDNDITAGCVRIEIFIGVDRINRARLEYILPEINIKANEDKHMLCPYQKPTKKDAT